VNGLVSIARDLSSKYLSIASDSRLVFNPDSPCVNILFFM